MSIYADVTDDAPWLVTVTSGDVGIFPVRVVKTVRTPWVVRDVTTAPPRVVSDNNRWRRRNEAQPDVSVGGLDRDDACVLEDLRGGIVWTDVRQKKVVGVEHLHQVVGRDG